MTSEDSPNLPAGPPDALGVGLLLGRGVSRGFGTGASLATAYTGIVIPVVALSLVAANASTGKSGEAVLGAGIVSGLAWIFAVFLGIIPGAFLGSVCGAMIAVFCIPFRHRLTPRLGAWAGFATGLTVVVLFHAVAAKGLLGSGGPSGSPRVYLFWLGGPSPFLLFGTTWIGASLCQSTKKALWPFRKSSPAAP